MASHVYAPLEHSEWNGWTPTDVVFPSFAWIIGVAMTIALARRLAAGVPRAQIFAQAFRRAVILYVLGLIVYAYPSFDLSTQRLLGVLQRLAICYLIATAIYLTTNIRGQIIWIVSLLAGYWLLMTLVPVPGYGAGHLDVERNFAHYIDRIVLGAHNYANTKTWDPEGIVSTLPAIATVLFGIMAGHILRMERTLAQRAAWLFGSGRAAPRRRPSLQYLAAHQQEALDQFLLAVHGGIGLCHFRGNGLAGGRSRLQAVHQAAGHHGHERDYGVHGIGIAR